MKKNSALFLLIVAVCVLFSACKHDNPDLSYYPEVCFQQDVLPIFQTNCAISGCHNAASAQEGYIFTSYNSIMNGIKPFDPYNSKAYQVLSSSWVNFMPPGNPLSEENRTIIRMWIEQGALNNDCSTDSVN